MPTLDELARLYDAHAQALFGFLLNFTGSEADTRDLLQEVFVRLAQRPGLLDGVESERGFLVRLAHHLAIDGVRRRSTRERKHAAFGDVQMAVNSEPADADGAVIGDALEQALQGLPAEQRAVVHLKLWGGMTFEEVAKCLELSPNTAASRYRYGIDKLRDQLRPLYNEIQ
ncbi:MAG TPA: sigma-70 family RNA polymerase sigma factor [Chthoniobacteraceae bacterium]|jgi:RNA polymerase sigma-70 factor (ECF subfamily)